jgi:hypothetical protein
MNRVDERDTDQVFFIIPGKTGTVLTKQKNRLCIIGFSAILFFGMSLESLHQVPLELRSLFSELELVIQGKKMNADNHDNEEQADPDHHTLDRKEGRPEKTDERDQV